MMCLKTGTISSAFNVSIDGPKCSLYKRKINRAVEHDPCRGEVRHGWRSVRSSREGIKHPRMLIRLIDQNIYYLCWAQRALAAQQLNHSPAVGTLKNSQTSQFKSFRDNGLQKAVRGKKKPTALEENRKGKKIKTNLCPLLSKTWWLWKNPECWGL